MVEVGGRRGRRDWGKEDWRMEWRSEGRRELGRRETNIQEEGERGGRDGETRE